MNTATEELEVAPVKEGEAKAERVAQFAESYREEHRQRIAMIDRAESLLLRLPDDVLDRCSLSNDWLQISSLSRQQVEDTLSVIGAGKLVKSVCSGDSTRIDYEGDVDGVHIIIYGAQPPPSCRIKTEQVYVPAHNKIVRKLVCA